MIMTSYSKMNATCSTATKFSRVPTSVVHTGYIQSIFQVESSLKVRLPVLDQP